ncbi:MAG: CmcI family methyltransferase [Acidimicrobiales bacterium]
MTDRHENNPDARPQEQQFTEKNHYPSTPPVPRPFATAFDDRFLSSYHKGVMSYTYKGVSCLKSPIDLAIYMLLIYDLKPRSIIEIGSFHGGAALFYRDICKSYDLDTRIVTVDYRVLESNPTTESADDIEFVHADAMDLASSDLHAKLDSLPRPWLVIEDSAHTRDVSLAVMCYFKDRMQTGEYLIIEDGVIEDQGANWRYGGGPNLAVHDFFVEHPDEFELDTSYNDFFGVNASFNPNGYLRKS